MNDIDKKILIIDSCEIINTNIKNIFEDLLKYIQNIPILEHKLFSIEFLSSFYTNDLLITLIYHKKLDDIWEQEAQKIQNKFDISIVGRSKKQKVILQKEYIQENLYIFDKMYKMNYYEASFSQPNTQINEKMIEFVKKYTKNINGDLLELYCGCGNFTITLADNFHKILATEISKKSILSAKENMQLNNVENISFARLSSQESIQAFKKVRLFNRLRHIRLDDYDFKAVFIDPPRAGVDEETLEFIKQFEYIIYISCNIDTLHRDLEILKNSHKVNNWAIFDQFAYTHHIEMGIILQQK
jgi:tRNA (uracil-5-)-methyltransferase